MELAPAFPIIEISRELILAAINGTLNGTATSGVYTLNHTVTSGKNSSLGMTARSTDNSLFREPTSALINTLVKRDAEPCAANQPCPDER